MLTVCCQQIGAGPGSATKPTTRKKKHNKTKQKTQLKMQLKNRNENGEKTIKWENTEKHRKCATCDTRHKANATKTQLNATQLSKIHIKSEQIFNNTFAR